MWGTDLNLLNLFRGHYSLKGTSDLTSAMFGANNFTDSVNKKHLNPKRALPITTKYNKRHTMEPVEAQTQTSQTLPLGS